MKVAPRRLLLVGVAAVCAGCVAGRTSVMGPHAERDWPAILAQAQAAGNARRYADADRLLAEFARRYPSTEEAAETIYWRAVFKLDPNNPDGSPQGSQALFDSYLKSEGTLEHGTEAEVLRRLATRLDQGAFASASGGGPSPSAGQSAGSAAGDRGADLKVKDAEIQKLKDELAKANEELERIKRRLTAPTKP
jgi:hypothetical protein